MINGTPKNQNKGDQQQQSHGSDKRSERHIRYQMRLARILTKYGFESVETEARFPYSLLLNGRGRQFLKIKYRVDVTGRKDDRRIAIEIDGYMGHKSKRAYEMDGLRTRRIQEAYGPIEIYRFTFKRLAKWTNHEIAEEMRL